MFVDASVAVAIAGLEPDWTELAHRLGKAKRVIVSPVAIYEAVSGLARLRNDTVSGADLEIAKFLENTRAEVVPIDARIGSLAIAAFARYGKGRHKAKLNMGDCFAYACAKAYKVPLLYKGSDFAHTDIEAA